MEGERINLKCDGCGRDFTLQKKYYTSGRRRQYGKSTDLCPECRAELKKQWLEAAEKGGGFEDGFLEVWDFEDRFCCVPDCGIQLNEAEIQAGATSPGYWYCAEHMKKRGEILRRCA